VKPRRSGQVQECCAARVSVDGDDDDAVAGSGFADPQSEQRTRNFLPSAATPTPTRVRRAMVWASDGDIAVVQCRQRRFVAGCTPKQGHRRAIGLLPQTIEHPGLRATGVVSK
jgi:hypothetical protein